MNALFLLTPALCLCAFSFLLLAVDAGICGVSARARSAGFWIAILGLIAAAGLLRAPGAAPLLFGRQMLIWDGLSYFLTGIGILTAFFVVLLSERYRGFEGARLGAYYALLLLAVAGIYFISASNDFLMIFISIEMIGVPSFILSGYLRGQPRSNEAAMKFFLIGAFSSAMLVYGISILYGLTGSTSLTFLRDHPAILQDKPALVLIAVFLILVSFGFKIALAPFHMWVPDVFEGAPTPIAAFLSVAPKIAGAAIALRVFGFAMAEARLGILNVLAVLAALTMTVGNVIGLRQTQVVRLLAYSSIAHMGYLLMGLVAGNPLGTSGVYLYGWAYLFMNLGAFVVVICLSNATGSNELSSFAGLAKRAPALSALLAFFLISLAGLPPTAGFVAKFYVFSAALQADRLWLVVIGAVNSVISVGYYFKILHAMYFQAPADPSPIPMSFATRFALAVTSFFTLMIGVSPEYFMAKAQGLASALSIEKTAPAATAEPAQP